MARSLRQILSSGGWLPVIRRFSASETPGRVALTLDDGPDPQTTPRILTLLAHHEASATFFLTGERAARFPDLVQAIVSGGHAVYAHGWDHIRLEERNEDEVISALSRAEALLSRFRPTPSPYLVRLPYASGLFEPWIHAAVRRWRADAQFAHWSVPFHDHLIAARCAGPDDLQAACAAAVAKAFERRGRGALTPGAVLLMHENPYDIDAPLNGEVAPAMLAVLLERLKASGLRASALAPKTPSPVERFVLI